MLDKLISAGVFGLVFVVVLNVMYRNRMFLRTTMLTGLIKRQK